MRQDLLLECKSIHHTFGNHHVLYDVNLEILRGEIVALVGPSGCGKSTLLNAIVGTLHPNKGSVLLYGDQGAKRVEGPGRDRGIVYQHYTLFPFLNAQENVAMGLMLDQTSLAFRLFRWPRWRRMRRDHLCQARELLERFKLGHATRLYPHQMSGGMRQRVAVAQTLIMKPDVLLLDEPFGALDEATREELQRTLLTLYAENCKAKAEGGTPPYTILIVTHELNEALYVGDRVVGLSQYWDWKGAGLKTSPGATIVYDQVAPVYQPEEDRNFDLLLEQRNKIREAAFDPNFLQDRYLFKKFWEQVEQGRGGGILS